MWENRDKILGVLGGMGPLATQLFYRQLIERTQASKDQDHLNMIILNHATMPDRTAAILSGDGEELYQKMLTDVLWLADKGVAAIAIPCNTSHYFIDALQKETLVPIIHMIRETINSLSDESKSISTVGILATDGTIQNGLYQNECEKAGITPVIPSPEAQKLVMKIIYDGVKGGGIIDENDFLTIERELIGRGCQAAILACTELSVFKETHHLPGYYIDAMEVLAEKSIQACGKTVKKK